MSQKNVCKSWTRSSYEKIELSHTWTIEKFSLRKEKVLYSSKFSSIQQQAPRDESGQNKKVWRMMLHPNGENEKICKDHLSLYLELLTRGPDDVVATSSFSLFDDKGNCLGYSEKTNDTFCSKDPKWGYPEFRLINKIEGKLPNDVLKVNCEISYLNIGECVSGTGTEQPPLEEAQFCDLSDNFGALLLTNNQEFSDVTLYVGENKTEFKAHRIILVARSPYFAAMFRNDFKEKRENGVEIKEVKPEIFREILAFIYTGKVPKNMDENVAKEVLVAADRFILKGLKMATEYVISSKLTIENVSEILILSDTHSAETLKKRSNDFVAANLKEVVKTEGWQMMILGHPHLTNETILRSIGGEGFQK